MDDEWMKIAENRVSELERIVFGKVNDDLAYPKDQKEVVATIWDINQVVKDAVSERPKIEAVMKRIDELNNILDPQYAESVVLSEESKYEIVLAAEERIRRNADLLLQIQSLVPVLDSEHIKHVPNKEEKLKELKMVQLEQQEELCSLTDGIRAINDYNKLVGLINKQFGEFDILLKEAEESRQKKSFE